MRMFLIFIICLAYGAAVIFNMAKFNTDGRGVCISSVFQDAKSHVYLDEMIADEADVRPMKLLYASTPASGYFDHCPDNYGGGDGEQEIYIGEIPKDDGTNRQPYDKTTAYGAANVGKFRGALLEYGDEISVVTGDLTAELPGLFLKCGADGIADEPAVPAKTAPDQWGHGFRLIKGVSASESIIKYLGPNCSWDDT